MKTFNKEFGFFLPDWNKYPDLYTLDTIYCFLLFSRQRLNDLEIWYLRLIWKKKNINLISKMQFSSEYR